MLWILFESKRTCNLINVEKDKGIVDAHVNAAEDQR
jgi:hypothetical protein